MHKGIWSVVFVFGIVNLAALVLNTAMLSDFMISCQMAWTVESHAGTPSVLFLIPVQAFCLYDDVSHATTAERSFPRTAFVS